MRPVTPIQVKAAALARAETPGRPAKGVHAQRLSDAVVGGARRRAAAAAAAEVDEAEPSVYEMRCCV